MLRKAIVVASNLLMFSGSAFADQEPVKPITFVSSETPASSRDESATQSRPRALTILYVSYAALQSYDAYSTTAGVKRGARESNPLMTGIAGNQGAFWAVKAGTTAASVLVVERLWKKNRVAAIITMAAMNGVSAAVAARNASVLKTLQ